MSYSNDSLNLLYADNREPPEPAPATGPAPPEAYIPRAGSEELLEYSNLAPEGYVPSVASPAAPTFPEPYMAATPEVKRRSTTHASSHSSLSSDSPPRPPDDPKRQSLVRASAVSLDATARSASGNRRRRTQTSAYNLDDILQAFASSHHDSKEMRRSLKVAMQKLEQAKQRADHAEHIAAQLAGRVNKVAGQKSTAARDASAVREELNLYKVQYTNAQHELERGNRALHDSETRRDEAEAAAARARDRARDMRTQLLVERAREEGRRAGLQEGLRLYRGRHYIDEYDLYSDGQRDADDAMDDILTQQNEPVRSEYTSRSRRTGDPPTRRSTRSTQRTPQPPPQRPQYTPSDRTDSQPILMQGEGPTPESFFMETPTPAPRETYAQDTTESISTDTTSTLPLAPPALIIPPQRMSTIHEVPSRTSVGSTVPTITREEPRTSSRSSRRSGVRSQPPPPRERTPSPAPTIPLEPHEIPPSPSNAFAPPPGAVDYAGVAVAGQARSPSPGFGVPPLEPHPPPFHPKANPNVQPPPFVPSAPPSPRGSMYGVGSPNMTTRELQQSFRDSRVGSLNGSTHPNYTRVQPPAPIPPRFTPSPQMPAPLAPQPQRHPQPFAQPRPSSSNGPIPQPFVPSSSETTSSRHGHRRSQSANIPPPNHEVQLPQPSPYHPRHAPSSLVRRSTSGGVPIQISVESPSDPGNTPTPASQPGDDRYESREFLSPRHMPSVLPPRPSSSTSSPVVPSPTSTPRSVSNPLPQPGRVNPSVPVAAPLYGQAPDPNAYYRRGPPPVVPSTGTARPGHPRQAPVPVVPPSSSSGSRPQRYPPRVHDSQSPEDTRPPAAATSRMYSNLGRSASMSAAPPSNTVPIVVPPPGSGRSPRLANGPLPGQPAIVQAEGAQARPAAYRGQQPVPIPPRHGSPAPLMVPSPEIRGAPLYVPSPEARVAALGSSYAGTTPRMGGMNGLPQDQGGYIPRSPTGSVSNLAPPSPRGPHANPLFTRFDRNSMENMGDMSQVALATATQPPEEPTSGTNVFRGIRNVFGGRGKRK